ncbi:hypothetical protein [Cohnella sp. AR92]|uniref:hypothetical protein n=1 Tax=Cohnella sp. AR92 TaxID=648716 RepID=UPI000F8CBFA3|nr:hypothetical protein [Cohnella sp. AR92]RUS46996.1 hypothetical protein ELR57_11365 [Cohnella sp. AR92]
MESRLAMYRTHAEEAAKQNDPDTARSWLMKAQKEQEAYLNLRRESEQKKAAADQLEQTLARLTDKLHSAKELRRQWLDRSRNAASRLQAETDSDLDWMAAVEQLKEDTLLAEAAEEVRRSRPY